MTKKRKSENTGLDEVEKTMYTTFCTAANSLSQLYTQAQNQQKLAFQAGERHGSEKLYQWILRQQESGSRVTAGDIFSYLQNELDYGGDELSTSPGSQFQYQGHGQQQNQFSIISNQMTFGAVGSGMVGQSPRLGISDQNKNSVFSNALSSPVRRSLQPFHIAQGGCYPANNVSQIGNGGRRSVLAADVDHGCFPAGHASASPQHGEHNGMNSLDSTVNMYGQQPHQNRDAISYSENDSSMDMNAESPADGFYH